MLRALLERPVSVAIGTLTLVILGFFSLLRLPVSLLPTLERPRLTVTARDADRSREDLAKLVAQPLERRLASLPGALELYASIDDGECRLVVETEWQTDVDRLRIDAERRLAEVAGLGLDELVVRVESGDIQPILGLAVFGGRSAAERTLFVDKVVIPELGRLSGAGRIERLGGASRRLVVRPHAAALAARGLTADDVVARLRSVGRTRPVGRLRDGGKVRPLFMREPVTSLAELASRRFGEDAGVALGDMADVLLEQVPDAGFFQRDGDAGVLVEVHRAPGANAVLLARSVRRTLAELARRSEAGFSGLRTEIVHDASLEVIDALTQLALAAFLGLLLGTAVLRFMLGSWRPTFALSVVVPSSILIAFGGFYLWGVSLDIVSLAGLALAAGMLVDNSIVVLEAIASARDRKSETGEPPGDDAVVRGTRRIALALVASFITTAVVFVPLIYLQGLARAFFGVQAFAIVTALAVSLVLSLTLTPMLAGRSARREAARSEIDRGPVSGGRRPGQKTYLRWLDRSLASPWAVILVAGALLLGVVGLMPMLPRELVPPGTASYLEVDVRLPPGLGREAAVERLVAIEEAVKEEAVKEEAAISDGVVEESAEDVTLPESTGVPESVATSQATQSLASTATILRRRDPLRSDAGDVDDRGEVRVTLLRHQDLGRDHLERFRTRLRRRLAEHAGVETDVRIGRGAVVAAMERSSRSLQIEVSATSERRAESLAEKIAAAVLEESPNVGLRRVSGDGRASLRPRPSMALEWDGWRLAQLDAELGPLNQQVRSALGGFYAGKVDMVGVEPEILVEATLPSIPTLMPMRPASSGASEADRRVVPLSALASVEYRQQPPPLERRNGRPAIRLELVNAGAVDVAGIEELLSGVSLAVDERVRLVGPIHELRRSFSQLRLALALGLLLVFLSVAALYESLRLPLVVMTTVPIAAAGALGALLISGQSLNVMSFLGILLLTGIVVNNAIVLVHRIEQCRAAGRAGVEAIRQAASERYRPILMTTLTTLLGMVPLALVRGQGVELRGALAVAVSGGLVTSLFATLLLVPVLYQVWVRRGE